MSQDRIRELEQECNKLRARVQILEQVIKYQNSQGAVGEAVAITADGRVYYGSAMPGSRIRNKFLDRLLDRISRASVFVFNHLRRDRTNLKPPFSSW